MKMTTELLSTTTEDAYTAFLSECKGATLFHTVPYRNVLRDVLHSDDRYILAFYGDKVIGALPLFIKRNAEYGNVLNSLPFFGSNGGVIGAHEAAPALETAWHMLAEEEGCVLSTLIGTYRDTERSFTYRKPAYTDTRVSQQTPLALNIAPDDRETVILFDTMTKRARNSVTKARRSGLYVSRRGRTRELNEMQQDAMTLKGGRAKPTEFYDSVERNFADTDYSVYYAWHGDKIIAGLLMFYYKDMAEYFSPATDSEHREKQPMSMLIYEAMQDAMERGCTTWNWGGIRKTREKANLYRYKQGFGARDVTTYQYNTIAHTDISKLLATPPDVLAQDYEWFYVVPYSACKGHEDTKNDE